MTYEDYYGDYYPLLKKAEADLLELIGCYQAGGFTADSTADLEINPQRESVDALMGKQAVDTAEGSTVGSAAESIEDTQPIIYVKSRIKSPESMVEKLRRSSFATDADTAMANMHDAVGIRVICSFLDNVYQVADWLGQQDGYEVVERKDYIAYPKPNGYRSLHLILRIKGKEEIAGLLVEVQLRTIAIDFWAALEHQMKYKHSIRNERMIREELKRCADEIASVDMSMQTIRDAIRES